ncbi:MAG: arylesterase [Gammaproteobacteria bacterium]|nr:arylesterase [Pseudomonadales bacterium]MCP5349158.1 arylesterase [Pseudomonadales bacterium]
MKHITPGRTLAIAGFTLLLGLLVAARASADPTHTLMVYGDSLSAGYGIEESQGWVELLKQRVAGAGYPYRVINGSVSGETTTGGLTRLPAMLESYTPDLVILELGGNDGLRGLPLNAIRENLVAMVKMAQSSGARVLLAGIQIPPNYGPRYTEPFFRQFEAIAGELELPLVPFLIDGIPQHPELMQDDGIHPVAAAQGMILDNVWPVLEPMLESAGWEESAEQTAPGA